MKVLLAYGRTGLEIDVPDGCTDVVEPKEAPGIEDEEGNIAAAVRRPMATAALGELAGAGDSVVIVVNDGTRPMPSARVLPVLLAELAHVPRDQITILVATGTHRANTPAELDEMLGPAIARGYRVVNHDARDERSLAYLGVSTRGTPIFMNRLYLQASVKILTGFIEPHFFAGFSGGPKPAMPGLAGLATVLGNHGPAMIAHPKATFGVLEGNPIHEEQREIALLTRPTFSLNVALNKRHQITGVWAGEMLAVHAAGVAFVRATAMREITRQYDVVLSTNSGFPLDQNLYQSVKGMTAAARLVRPGGAIVLLAECRDGLPDHGSYQQLLARAASTKALLATIHQPGFQMPDQWQAQKQALVQEHARVYLHSSLADQVVRDALLTPAPDLQATIDTLTTGFGPQCRVAVLPEGPMTVMQVH